MNEAEIRAQLQEKVNSGEISAKQAEDLLRSWWMKNLGIGGDPSVPKPYGAEDVVSAIDPVAPVSLQPESAGSDVLANIDTDAARAELEKRAEIEGMSFFETLTSPDALERLGKAALKGPSQMVNAMTNALPGLALKGVEAVTGDETAGAAAEGAFGNFGDLNQNINDQFGSSDALTPAESFMETASSALVPGGIGVKAASVAVDFTVDQTVRELTDTQDTEYQTTFDRAGLGFDGIEAVMSPLVAIPLAAAATLITAKGVGLMKQAVVVTPPKLKDIHDFDKFAPTDMVTHETSADARAAYLIDQQTALTNVVKRTGLPNPDDIENTITLNTHSAGNTRAREAVNSGFLEVDGQRYRAPVSPRKLFDAAMQLPFEVNKELQKYINLNDMIDDARIALSKNVPGNHVGTIGQLTAQMRRIERQYPIVTQFHAEFKNATKAVRDFLEGDVLETAQRQWLDTNRPNYVPLDINPVDVNAPFVERLIQTQRDGQVDPDDWFLQTRQSAGNYDPDTRGNPFEQLAKYTEAALRLGMKNNTRVKIVDAMLNSRVQSAISTNGKNLIRLVTENDDLAGNVDRLIKVYRNGKQETYIAPKLTAQLLKFDPYVAKNPAFFIPKRIAEWTMVGPGSIVFAPVTALRDTIGGAVMRPQGVNVPNPLQVAAAVPKQLWAKAQGALASNIEAGLLAGQPLIPTQLMDVAGQRQLANKLSNYYINSLYHQANNAGGFDASIMKNNIVAAQNALGEIKRTLREGSAINNPAMTNIVTRFGVSGARTIIDGFVALFDSIQDAPRFAAFEKTVTKGGKSVEEAATLARNITGDTGRSGMVYRPDGSRLGYDATDRGVGNLVTPAIGATGNFLRESAPFVNPMIQGTRRVINSFKDDPAGTMMRTWLYVGLPSVGMFGWNEMLGKEYNDYAMNRRSAQDIASNMYIGIPGMPPEMGIEIPLPQELQLFSSPYARTLYAITRGEESDSMSSAMQTLASSIFGNTLEIGAPVALEAFANAAGTSIDGFLGLGGTNFQIREDNQGFLPQNLEMMVRTLFTNVGTMGLQLAYTMSGEESQYGSFNDFVTTVVDDVSRRMPVVKNVTGRKSANVTFSIPAEYNKEKETTMAEFMPYWRQFFDPRYKSEDGFDLPGAKRSKKDPEFRFVDDKGLMQGREDLPGRMIMPTPMEEPTNPFFQAFGQTLYDYVQINDIGMSGLDDRDTTYKQIIRQIRAGNAGDRAAIAEWQKRLMKVGKDPDATEETQRLRELIKDFNLNLEVYSDRIKLINIIENERSFVIQQKLEAIAAVEDKISQSLREKGLIGKGDNFRIEKHMKPFDENPLGITREMIDGLFDGAALAKPELQPQ